MNSDLFKIIEEYIVYVDGLDHPVRGRIQEQVFLNKNGSKKQIIYSWTTSHNHSGYYPSAKSSSDIDEVRFLLFKYLEDFGTKKVTINSLY